MPMYWTLKHLEQADRQRTVDSILRLRSQLRREIPQRTTRDTLLLATWNLRDFDSNKFGHGPRLTESLHYIAEIISAFDIVAVQEINRSLRGLKNIVRILGTPWTYIVTDVTEGPGGNGERMAFIYDSGKVQFQNIAGEIVLPQSQLIAASRQFARTPFLCAFQSHWLKFNLCSVHMYYGAAGGEGYKRRVKEIDQIGKFLRKRYKRYDENFILLGDMNIVSPDDDTMKALKKNKFTIPEHGPTNMMGTKHYDQIAFMRRAGELELGPSKLKGETNNCNVLKIYKSIFRTRDSEIYYPLGKKNKKWPRGAAARKKYFRNWRTFQLSDHLPLWVELKIDFTERYLNRILGTK